MRRRPIGIPSLFAIGSTLVLFVVFALPALLGIAPCETLRRTEIAVDAGGCSAAAIHALDRHVQGVDAPALAATTPTLHPAAEGPAPHGEPAPAATDRDRRAGDAGPPTVLLL